MTFEYRDGYIDYYFNSTDNVCYNWIVMQGLVLMNEKFLIFCFMLGLAYLFYGLALCKDIMVHAITHIINKKKLRQYSDKSNEKREYPVEVWNPTIVNLTLLSLSSAAP
jgi:hypothetical protein